MKICNFCKEEKSLSKFNKDSKTKDGYNAQCKECYYTKDKIWPTYNNPGFKICAIGKDEKPLTAFGNNRANKDGLEYSCKDCMNKKKRDTRATGIWKERELSYGKEYRKNNQPKRTKIQQSRRARKASIPDTMPDNWWNLLLNFYGSRCMNPLCQYEIDEWNKLSHDHIIPISNPNSSHSLSNSQILCRKCNSAKRNKIIDYRDGRILDILK